MKLQHLLRMRNIFRLQSFCSAALLNTVTSAPAEQTVLVTTS